jgi:hypothetical protein
VSDARLLLSLALALALLLMGVCSLGYYFSRLSALLQNRQTLSDNFKLFSCKPTLFYALPTIACYNFATSLDMYRHHHQHVQCKFSKIKDVHIKR